MSKEINFKEEAFKAVDIHMMAHQQKKVVDDVASAMSSIYWEGLKVDRWRSVVLAVFMCCFTAVAAMLFAASWKKSEADKIINVDMVAAVEEHCVCNEDGK